ncbi:MAG: hypothetical protein LUQ65_09030 [Candidatus Helarchaeota archaeon]|nr:hypothetical protein [Candidatus Helarchaeota archaeon]
MVNSDQSIDYEGFKGAGGPNAPPPQKPNSNPTKTRLTVFFTFLIELPIVLILFTPWFMAAGVLWPHILGGLCAGITLGLYDWIGESYAYVKGLWFCYGGYQKIGKVDLKHVPFEMVLGFVVMGFCLAFVSYFPELFRYWGWNFWPISDPALDLWMLPGFLIIFALIGAYGDFRTKRSGVWMNGPTWFFWKCAFYAWLPLLTAGLLVDRLILLTWANPLLLLTTILIVAAIFAVVIIVWLKKVL